MQVTPVYIVNKNRWMWAVAFLIGLLVSSVITGLSVGLPIGLACSSYGKHSLVVFLQLLINQNCINEYTKVSSFTEYDSKAGPGSGNELYLFAISNGNKLLDECKAVCSADSSCAYFEHDYNNFYCLFYTSSQISDITGSASSNVYLKSGYNLQLIFFKYLSTILEDKMIQNLLIQYVFFLVNKL